MEHGIRSPLSQCPFQLELFDRAGPIAAGTAFFYQSKQKRSFLVTNWHNVSGRHFISREPNMSGTGTPRFPTGLRAKLMSDTGMTDAKGSSLLSVRNTDVTLYDQEYMPVWFEHPQLGSLCDVVALPLGRPGTARPEFHRAANTVSKLRVPVIPGGNVFIIGYPLGISVSAGLPVFKSGYIASEPHFPVNASQITASHGTSLLHRLSDAQGHVRLPGIRRVRRELERRRSVLLGWRQSQVPRSAWHHDR